ncbi:CHRD domain-containing protein [Rugamonas apoptosis]|uniref:CHRD domain-containing protein n=1 Tax=Rugamonas apoptosis TaxID=2758570 RepID=A0A7W2F8P4_9BURK|nr:CHRD domain-containing protein [Rugamonas apoptosis]MBA5687104.1 CHRD domain-containing protein [Rugamonas apoptosis]
MNKQIRHGAAALTLLLSTMTAAHAASYAFLLDGAHEDPANASKGIGAAVINFDDLMHQLQVTVAYGGLDGVTTAAHIHCCTTSPGTGSAGVATELPSFTGFPLGGHGGAYTHLFDTSQASSWNPAFITAHGGTTTGAEKALMAGLSGGEAYLNIHSDKYPNGEIRGFTPAAPVPEPSGLAMLAVGLPLLLLRRRQRG